MSNTAATRQNIASVRDLVPDAMAQRIAWSTFISDQWGLAWDDMFDTLCVGGNVLRHAIERDPQGTVEAILAGEPDPLRVAVREWSLAIPDECIMLVEQLCLNEADYLEGELRLLAKKMGTLEWHPARVAGWQGDLMHLAMRREFAQGALVVMGYRRDNERRVVLSSFARVDMVGRLVMAETPTFHPNADSQLLRLGSQTDPEAWWSQVSLDAAGMGRAMPKRHLTCVKD